MEEEHCLRCGNTGQIRFPYPVIVLCDECVPRDPECSCERTGGGHDIGCTPHPF